MRSVLTFSLWLLCGCHALLPLDPGGQDSGAPDRGADLAVIDSTSLEGPPPDTVAQPDVEPSPPDGPPPDSSPPPSDLGTLTWKPYAYGTSENLHDVWGVTPTEIYIAGDMNVRQLGGTWPIVASSNGPGFWSVRIDSASGLGFAVGGNGISHRYNSGTTWTNLGSSGGTLYGLWVDGTNALAVGVQEIWAWNHLTGAWKPAPVAVSSLSYTAVWASSPTDAWVASNGALWHYDGKSLVAHVVSTAAFIWGIDGTGPKDIHAVSSNGAILHYGGTMWKHVKNSPTGLRDVWAYSTNLAYAVGLSGAILRYNGASWTAMTSGTSADLYGVWGSSPTDVYAVGANGTVRHLTP